MRSNITTLRCVCLSILLAVCFCELSASPTEDKEILDTAFSFIDKLKSQTAFSLEDERRFLMPFGGVAGIYLYKKADLVPSNVHIEKLAFIKNSKCSYLGELLRIKSKEFLLSDNLNSRIQYEAYLSRSSMSIYSSKKDKRFFRNEDNEIYVFLYQVDLKDRDGKDYELSELPANTIFLTFCKTPNGFRIEPYFCRINNLPLLLLLGFKHGEEKYNKLYLPQDELSLLLKHIDKL